MVLAPLTGRLVDRVDSRILLVSVGLAQAACCALMAFVNHPAALIGLVATLAAGLAVTQPTFGALLPEMAGRENLPRATAIGQTATAVGMLAGPALAGVLVGQYGLRVPLLLDAGTYLAIALAGLLVRTRRNARATREHERPAASTVRWRLRRDPLLGSVVVLIGTVVGAVSLVNVVDVFFIRTTLGASTTSYGLLATVWTGAMLVGSWLVARRAGDDGALGLTMVGLLGTSCVLLAAAGRVPAVGWLIPLWIAGGLTNGGENTVAGVLLGRRAPAEQRGRAFATAGAVIHATSLVGFVLGGALVEVVAPGTLMTAAGLVGLAVTAGFAVPVWRAAVRERQRRLGEAAHVDVPEPVSV